MQAFVEASGIVDMPASEASGAPLGPESAPPLSVVEPELLPDEESGVGPVSAISPELLSADESSDGPSSEMSPELLPEEAVPVDDDPLLEPLPNGLPPNELEPLLAEPSFAAVGAPPPPVTTFMSVMGASIASGLSRVGVAASDTPAEFDEGDEPHPDKREGAKGIDPHKTTARARKPLDSRADISPLFLTDERASYHPSCDNNQPRRLDGRSFVG